MKTSLTASLQFLLPAFIVLGLMGFLFQVSYFYALGLAATDILDIQHYVATGAAVTLPAFVLLLLIAQFKKFFSKSIHEDDTKKIGEMLSETTFEKQILFARMSLGVSLLYALITVLAAQLGLQWPLGIVLLIFVFFNFQNFFAAILLSPKHSRFTIVFMFFVAVAICFAAGGYGVGSMARLKTGVIQDDFIVRIERTGDTIVATAKPLTIAIPSAMRLLTDVVLHRSTPTERNN